MATRNENGDTPEPERDQEERSILRERLERGERSNGGAETPDSEPGLRTELLAELAAAETLEYTDKRARKRLAQGTAPVVQLPSSMVDQVEKQPGPSALDTPLRMGAAIISAPLWVLRWAWRIILAIGAAILFVPLWLLRSVWRLVRAVGAGIAAAFGWVSPSAGRFVRALGAGIAAALQWAWRQVVRLVGALGSVIAAALQWAWRQVVRLVRALGAGVAAALQWAWRGALRSLRAIRPGVTAAMRRAGIAVRQMLGALVRGARARPRELAFAVLLLALFGYGAIALGPQAREAWETVRAWGGRANQALVNAGAGIHRGAEILGLVSSTLPEPLPVVIPEKIPEPTRYLLEVVTDPPGARISVEGKHMRSPGELELTKPEKTLRVHVRKRSHRTAWRRVKVDDFQQEGEAMRYTLNVRLEPLSASSGPGARGRSGKKSASDKRPTIWLEPMPPRPSSEMPSSPPPQPDVEPDPG